jgi:CBS domain-containing protein
MSIEDNRTLSYVQDVEAAINREPLIVTPDISLLSAIALMAQKHNSGAGIDNPQTELGLFPKSGLCRSCVLVVKDSTLLGIITERDIVRLTALGSSLQELTVGEVMTRQVITLPLKAFSDILGTLFLFRRYKIRHLPIVGDSGEVLGIVSQESIRQVLQPTHLLQMRLVSEVMTTSVISTSIKTPVLQLAQMMAEHRVSCIVITQDKESDLGKFQTLPVGIVTERDIVQFQALQLNISQLLAESVMSTPLFLLSPEDSLWKAHQEMEHLRVRRLVVSWDWGKGLGIVTQTNLLRTIDPIEMHGVQEALHEIVQQLEAKKNRSYFKDNKEILAQFHNLLSQTQLFLENILQQPDISSDSKEIKLSSALTKIEEMQNLLHSFDDKNLNSANNSQEDGDDEAGNRYYQSTLKDIGAEPFSQKA